MKIKSYLAGKTRKLILLLFDASCFALIAAAYYFANNFLAKPIVYDPYKFLANAEKKEFFFIQIIDKTFFPCYINYQK